MLSRTHVNYGPKLPHAAERLQPGVHRPNPGAALYTQPTVIDGTFIPARPVYNTSMAKAISHTAEYKQFITELKARVQAAQIKAARALNTELITLYWQIGQEITQRQKVSGWGDEVIAQVAKDLTRELGGIKGFSRTNLYRMKRFYGYYVGKEQFVPQAVGQIPWGHNVLIFEKIKDRTQALWYAKKTIEHGWARSTLQLIGVREF